MTARRRWPLVVTLVALTASAGGSLSASRARSRAARPRGAALAPGLGPSLGHPSGIAVDASGALAIIDRGAIAVLTVDASTGDRTILSDAEHGGGPPLPQDTPQFSDRIQAIAIDANGHRLVAGRSALLRVDRTTGERTVLSAAGTRGAGPSLNSVGGLALEAGGTIVATNGTFGAVLRVDPDTGDRTLVSGCTTGGTACVPVGTGVDLDFPAGIVVAESGTLFVAADAGLIRVDPVTGDRTLVSGGTTGTGPDLPAFPAGLASDGSGGFVWAHETGLIHIDASTGIRTALSDGAVGAGPAFRKIEGLVLEPAGTVAVADADLGGVVRVPLASGHRVVVSGGPIGDGPRLTTCFAGAAVEASGSVVVADCEQGLLRVDPATGSRSILSGRTVGSGPAFRRPLDVAVEGSGALLVADVWSLKRVDPISGTRSVVADASTGSPFRTARSLALEPGGTALVGDAGISASLPIVWLDLQVFVALLRVDLATGRSEVVSGGGLLGRAVGRGAPFIAPIGAVTPTGRGTAALVRTYDLYEIDLPSGNRRFVTRPNDDGDPEIWAQDVAMAADGSWLVLDAREGRIVRVEPASGVRTVVSGQAAGSGPQFDWPTSLDWAPDGTLIVVTRGESTNTLWPFTTVMRVDPVTGNRTVLTRF